MSSVGILYVTDYCDTLPMSRVLKQSARRINVREASVILDCHTILQLMITEWMDDIKKTNNAFITF